ncbi:RraA family protein [Aeoliella sp.]|uniref:RraA family protein n=1 Tax=Aeoliella sp. TaxID=2795800 RepID=UPI003CCBEAE4
MSSFLPATDQLELLRDAVEIVELTEPEAEIVSRYESLYTGAVNDVLREMCLLNQALPPGIAPLRDEMVVAGFAFTIRSVCDPTIEGELATRVEMLDKLTPNSVCVWNANGEDNASHWGGVMTRAAKKRGVRGAIIDGGIRDTRDILQLKFPVWTRYRTSNGALSRCKITGYQVPVLIGGVLIKPGDLVMADIDGALVVPRSRVEEVLLRAEQVERNEIEIKSWVDAGMKAEEISERGGYF